MNINTNININNKLNYVYNLLVVSDDQRLINSIKDSKDSNMLFTGNDLFELQLILSSIKKKKLDILVIDLDVVDEKSLEDLMLLTRNEDQLPIIIVSSNNNIESRIRILNKGVDDFIDKPIIIEEFIARIHSILRRYKKFINEKIIINEDIRINVLQRKVEVRGKQVKISSKEFGILKLLVENVNRIFSRKDILDVVWSDQNSVVISERTIDVHINRLRVALGYNISGESYIRTVRGAGYSFHIDEHNMNKHLLNNNIFESDHIYCEFERFNGPQINKRTDHERYSFV